MNIEVIKMNYSNTDQVNSFMIVPSINAARCFIMSETYYVIESIDIGDLDAWSSLSDEILQATQVRRPRKDAMHKNDGAIGICRPICEGKINTL